jgi:transposase-like protein
MSKSTITRKQTRRRFTKQQKLVAVQKARALQCNPDRSLYSISKELGINQSSLKRWCDQAGKAESGRFYPMEIIQKPSQHQASHSQPGVCIAGLSIEEMAKLVKLITT